MPFNIRYTEEYGFLIEQRGDGIVVKPGLIKFYAPYSDYDPPTDASADWVSEEDGPTPPGLPVLCQFTTPETEFLNLELSENDSKRVYVKVPTQAAFEIAGYIDICTDAGDSHPFYHFDNVEEGASPSFQGALAAKTYGISSPLIIVQQEDPEQTNHDKSKNEDKSTGHPAQEYQEHPSYWYSVTHILIGEVSKRNGSLYIKQYHRGPIFFQPPEPAYYGTYGTIEF